MLVAGNDADMTLKCLLAMASDGFFHGSTAQHESWQDLKRSPLDKIDRNAILVSTDTEGSGGQTGPGKNGEDDESFAKSVGFSVLRMADVADIAPSPLFSNWWQHMKVLELMHEGWDHIHPEIGWVEYEGGLLNPERSTRIHYTMPLLPRALKRSLRKSWCTYDNTKRSYYRPRSEHGSV